jgi:hypothetical protein
MRKSKFSIDGMSLEELEEQGIDAIDGYTDDTTWNGWNNVFVTKEQFISWIEQTPMDYSIDDKGVITIDFSEHGQDNDTFIPKVIDGITLYSLNGYCFVEIEEACNA